MESSKPESTVDAAESVINAYFDVHPLGGPRDEVEPVIDALMIALREAARLKQLASDDARKSRYSLDRAENSIRRADSAISALLSELQSRGFCQNGE